MKNKAKEKNIYQKILIIILVVLSQLGLVQEPSRKYLLNYYITIKYLLREILCMGINKEGMHCIYMLVVIKNIL